MITEVVSQFDIDLRQMRLKWTPSALWNHPASGFEHQKLEHISKMQTRTKEFEIVEISVEEGVDLGFRIKDFFFSM